MLSLFAWLYFYSIFVILAYSFIKLSIGVFLLRLTQRTKFKWALRGILGKPLAHITSITRDLLLTSVSIPGSIYAGLSVAHHLPMHTGRCWLRPDTSATPWNSYVL